MATNPTTNMHNLTTLIKRLEAATSRLEDMAASSPIAADTPPSASASAPTVANQKQVTEPLPEFIEDYDSLVSTTVKKFITLSDDLGGAVAEQASKVLAGFTNQRKFLLVTTKSKKPDMTSPDFQNILKPLAEAITAVNQIRDLNRASPMFNHLSTVSESIGVLAWVTIESKPWKHVEESKGSAQYYGNRVLKEFKDKDPKQVEWIQAYYAIFNDLAEYIKQAFPQGIPWNPQGLSPADAMAQVEKSESLSQESSQAPKPPAAAGGPPPPPPPPGAPPRFDIQQTPATPAPEAGGIGAVFSELNKGSDVTKGLRKVNPNEMTHKNPSLRAGATVPTRSDSQSSLSSISRGKSPAPGKKPKPESMRTKKPPRKELDGNKWIIENYDGESAPIEIEASMSHSILISRCNKTTIMVRGKANAITIDNSTRLSLVVESLVSSVDVIKSTNFALQVLGSLPTILMDQVDGAQVYLSKESMRTEVFSSKCAGINLNIIQGKDDDYVELALPEQIRTYIGKDGKIASEIVEHAG